jgi:hypothetical protein
MIRRCVGSGSMGPFGARAMAFDLVLEPLPSKRMEAHEVSPLVNSTENDNPEWHPINFSAPDITAVD